MSTLVNPITVTLQGGHLDGDTFELTPMGSVLPPMRLSYIYSETIGDREQGCWLNYECKDGVPEWCESAVVYVYAGKEPIK